MRNRVIPDPKQPQNGIKSEALISRSLTSRLQFPQSTGEAVVCTLSVLMMAALRRRSRWIEVACPVVPSPEFLDMPVHLAVFFSLNSVGLPKRRQSVRLWLTRSPCFSGSGTSRHVLQRKTRRSTVRTFETAIEFCEQALELKRDIVAGHERTTWNPARSLAPKRVRVHRRGDRPGQGGTPDLGLLRSRRGSSMAGTSYRWDPQTVVRVHGKWI